MSRDNKGYVNDYEGKSGFSDIALKEAHPNNYGVKEAYPMDAIQNGSPVNDYSTMDPKDIKRAKLRIYKNIIVVSFGFLFNFTAFSSLSNLQSSLNKEEGLGTGGLAVLYAALVVSCMFLPKFLIAHFGCKWTIVAAIVCYSAYIAANFHAVWATIVPGAIILGFGAAPLWSAKCTYVTEVGKKYALLSGESKDAVINRFFGIFFLIFQTSQIWGNLISSFVLNRRVDNSTRPSEEILAQCGANYCKEPENNPNSLLKKPPISQVHMLCGIYVASAFFGAILVALFLDKLDREVSEQEEQRREAEARANNENYVEKSKSEKYKPELLIATFAHLRDINQVLLIPLTMYSGLEQAFITGDFTKAFVGCSLGIWMVGFVMITFGVTNSICSYLLGAGVKYIGRLPFFCAAAVLNYGVQVTFLLWKPHPDYLPVFFVLAALWGMSDAVWQAQINALYGFLFTDQSEAAFANYRMWESIGFIMAFAYSNWICITVKIYILMGFLTVGMLGYFIVEWRQRKHRSADLD
ncbi:unnamed protein product [Owenia fusiformis]|uniref:Uncharacterized protein n=1 Tax=Owenia fusiformis TaxID=6347 RepID=A0A8J1UUK7_OWEFU|nr:unnamed protein product [Owenia fusiformis]